MTKYVLVPNPPLGSKCPGLSVPDIDLMGCSSKGAHKVPNLAHWGKSIYDSASSNPTIGRVKGPEEVW